MTVIINYVEFVNGRVQTLTPAEDEQVGGAFSRV